MRTFFLNQLIHFHSNNATNLRHLTSHTTPCCPTTEILYCDRRLLRRHFTLCMLIDDENLYYQLMINQSACADFPTGVAALPRTAPDKTARKPPWRCTAVTPLTPGGQTMDSSAAACSVRPTAQASPYHALSVGVTQQFFVFFVPGDLDVWPWHSNSGNIFVQYT